MTRNPLNVLIATLGSHGDMHPFMGIAREMRQRGHRVTLFAPGMYEETVREKLGIDFVPVGSMEKFAKLAASSDLWHARKGFGIVARGVAATTPEYYHAIVEHLPPERAGRTVLVSSTLVFAGRVVQEKFGVPNVTVHLSPSIFRSLISPAYTPPMPTGDWQPMWLRKFLFNLADEKVLDRALAPPLNAFRSGLGLPPARRILTDWVNSPDRVIGLFPDWFAPKISDWPRQTVLTGFPLYDEADISPLDAGLARFLDAGEPPIAFTPGSAMQHGRGFFEQAAAACGMLGRRGLLVSRHPENIPAYLPASIRAVSFAPFSTLLPRCAAFVHHGGIGSSAQALAAGIPQLVMPMTHDQPDNAQRLERLGVSATVPAQKFTAGRAAAALERLLASSAVKEACGEIKERLARAKPMTETAEWIERAAGQVHGES